jgi:hypothetical protein
MLGLELSIPMARYRIPSNLVSSLPLPEPEPREFPVLYSLFKLDVNSNRYIRCRAASYSDVKLAERVFRTELLGSIFGSAKYTLKPIDVECLGANLRFNK